MNKLRVIDGGLFTTVQDYGRPGFRKYGVPVSGVMDMKSFDLANKLVGNQKGGPLLECTLRGGKYRFENRSLIAITGALMNAKINGGEVSQNCSLVVKPGDELELGFASRGCRTYLALKGNLVLPKIMDSFSTYTLGKFGGVQGRILKTGDELEWDQPKEKLNPREASKEEIPYFSSKVTVRIIKGPEWEWLSGAVQQEFLDVKYQVSSQSNRMGIRLEGNSIESPESQMISSPVIPGIIQLPPNGNPIILMQDGQTIGGYPRIAKVLDEDLWRLGQVKAGDTLSFVFC
ncbi:MAG: biotin-dependent carboxyltransferase family protein [Balneola sp.]